MIKQVTVMRKDLNMRKGKMIAQGGHAAGKFVFSQLRQKLLNKEPLLITLNDDEISWILEMSTKIVLGIDSLDELQALVEKAKSAGITIQTIVDAGKTEFHGTPTLTCVAFGPNEADLIDTITGHLKPL